MAESFLQADYTTFIEYTYSKIVQLMGGKDKMINSLKNEVQKMKDNGVTFTSISVGLTEHIVNAGEEIHALVSQRLIMKVPGGTLAADSYLLAITSNGGTSWSFVDTAPLQNEETIKLIFPNYNMDLKIPPKAKPTFIKTQ